MLAVCHSGKKKNQVFPVLGAGIDFQKEKKKSPTRVKFVHIRISLKTKTKHLSAVAQFSLFSEDGMHLVVLNLGVNHPALG